LPGPAETKIAAADGEVPRIAFLTTTSPESSPTTDAFRRGLRDLGWVEGQNIIVGWRWGRGSTERFPDFAAEVVRLKVDLIVAANDPAGYAAQKATKTIPIVIGLMGDPVGSGFVASLARPGGNITGLSFQQGPDIIGKALQLLKEAVPTLSRVAVLWDPGLPGTRQQASAVEAAAPELRLQSQVVEVRSPGELEGAFARRPSIAGLHLI
jgi:putative tryptophan/tyrosine transport system substrate-binding protein